MGMFVVETASAASFGSKMVKKTFFDHLLAAFVYFLRKRHVIINSATSLFLDLELELLMVLLSSVSLQCVSKLTKLTDDDSTLAVIIVFIKDNKQPFN